jgi:hypothetical protein
MKIAQDKKTHFTVSLIITLFVGLIFASDGHEINTIGRGIIVGMSVGIGATLIKDFIWDLLLKKGVFDVMDIVFGVAGSILGGILLSLLNFI